MKKSEKPLKIVAIAMAAILVLMCAVMAYSFLCLDIYRGTLNESELPDSLALDEVLTREQAYADFEYYFNTVRDRHPAWLDGSAEKTEAFERQYQTERDSFGDTVTVRQLYLAALRTATALGDTHTNVVWRGTADRYINNFTQLNEYGAPKSVDGVPYQTLLDAYKSITPCESEEYLKHCFDTLVVANRFYLELFGIETTDGVKMTFSNGAEFDYSFVPLIISEGRESENESGWVYYSIDKENNLAVFTLKQCIYNDYYKLICEAFFNDVKKSGVTNIAVDLRGNGGGSAEVATEFLRYINVDEYKMWDMDVRFGWILSEYRNQKVANSKKEPIFNGNLYALTDIDTYSSAMDFAMLIGDNDLGLIVGEESGNNPSGYGNFVRFSMSNSRLSFTVSTKHWYRLDISKNGEPLTPDVETVSEKALLKVYELISK